MSASKSGDENEIGVLVSLHKIHHATRYSWPFSISPASNSHHRALRRGALHATDKSCQFRRARRRVHITAAQIVSGLAIHFVASGFARAFAFAEDPGIIAMDRVLNMLRDRCAKVGEGIMVFEYGGERRHAAANDSKVALHDPGHNELDLEGGLGKPSYPVCREENLGTYVTM